MSASQRLESTIDKAKEKEKKYEWLRAAELYDQALLEAEKKDFLKKGEIQEKIAHCLYRASFQAESQEEFKQRIQRAVIAYQKANGLYEKLTEK